MRAKSILIINRTFPPALGATGRVACDLALYLRKQGHKITIVTTADDKKHDQAKNLDVIRVEADQHPKDSWDYYKILRSLKRATKKLPRHDIVISMTDPPLLAVAGQSIAKKMKAKHIHWAMDLYPDLLPVLGKNIRPFFYKIIDGMMFRTMKKVDVLVPISNCMARYLSHKSISRKKMQVIENWPDKYLLGEQDSQSLMDHQKFRILYAGTIGLAHEFDTVISAAIYFQKTDPDIEFIFTARGRGYRSFEKKAKQAGLKNIQFISPQPSKKLNALMNAGDLHLVTMKQSAAGKLFPSKFYSACAAARPILYIGPAACDIHRKISTYHCGATIRNGDSRILVNAIKNYKENPEDWFKACEASKNLLNQNDPLHEWQMLVEKL